MRGWSASLSASLLLCAGGALAAPPTATPAPPPLEAYGRLPSLEEVRLSPDGTYIAFIKTADDARALLVERLSDHKLMCGVKVSNAKLRWVQWADNRHVVMTVSTAERPEGVLAGAGEWYLLESIDVETGRQKRLMEDPESTMNTVYGEPVIRVVDGHAMLFSYGTYFDTRSSVADGSARLSLYRTDVEKGFSQMVAEGEPDAWGWAVDAHGVPVAEIHYDDPKHRWTLKVRREPKPWIVSDSRVAPIETPRLLGFGRDGQALLVTEPRGTDEVLHEISLDDGKWGVAEPDPYDLYFHDRTSLAWIGGESRDGDTVSDTFFDPALDKVWRGVVKAYDGEPVRPVSWSDDHRKIILLVDGRRAGYGYALLDLDAEHVSWLGDKYAKVPVSQIAEDRPITYKAADGLVIHGYLTLPRDRPERALPLIVMPHGGPEGRDTQGFDWLSQALASRGYAVLRPNFRGSTGYGQSFTDAGNGQWGRKMQTDLSDGVRDLAARGVVDPKRVCIFGWSYGGYAALAGASLDRGIYRCAASMAGPSDLRQMLKRIQSDEGRRDSPAIRYWERSIGAKGSDDASLAEISPADQAERVDIPILLLHGKDDAVVPFEQSQIMADALKKAGKPVTLVALKGEDHWGSRSETRLQLLTAVVAFLEANNPPS